MKRASETDEAGVLDEAFLHKGGELGWDLFGGSRLTPAELLERFEDGVEDVESERAAVMRVMFGFVLVGWRRELSPRKVGERCRALASALGHSRGSGAPMLGARRTLAGEERREVARRILDYWFSYGSEDLLVGKLVLAMGLFCNHEELSGWSQTKLAKDCGETGAGMMERVYRVCNKPLDYTGASAKGTFQQGRDQRAKSSEVWKDLNKNKRAKNE